MALALERLDRLNFDQLIEEGRALLPDYAPAWTDHNLHDPGVTLMELLAWLAEMDLYRLERTTPAGRRAFLRRLGIELRPPRVAETVLVFSLDPPRDPLTLPAGRRVTTSDGHVIYQTTRDLDISPARLQIILSGPPVAPVAQPGGDLAAGRPFFALGEEPRPNDALYLGFSNALVGPLQVSLYVWSGDAAANRETWQRLKAEWRAARAEWKEACPPGGSRPWPCPSPPPRTRKSNAFAAGPCLRHWRRHYSATTIWEYYDQSGDWLPLSRVLDLTRSLSLSGIVRFAAPEPGKHAAGGVGRQGLTGLYFIRCRLSAGSYDCPPQIQGVALNAVVARHAVDWAEELYGKSDGRAGQRFSFGQAPVVACSSRVRVLVKGQEDGRWREALDWDRAGPHDRVYVLEPETGAITFGDGRAGRVPPAEAEIRVAYQSGGGPAGNLPPGRLVTLEPGQKGLQVRQPYPAGGGTTAESIAEARGRALAWLAGPQRAVTLADYEHLARQTPGVPVGRVYAIAGYHPYLSCLPAVGSVTVVVVPDCPGPRPAPGAAMLQAVRCYLECRRLISAELHVVAPAYTTIAVHARLHPDNGAAGPDLVEQARARLDDLLHPLRGGPQGQGWPAGREVVESEVMALLNALPGVAFVSDVSLQVEGISDPAGGSLSFWHSSSAGTLPAADHAFHVRLQVQPLLDEAGVRQAAGQALDSVAQRLRLFPAGRSRQQAWEQLRPDLAGALAALPGVLLVEEISWQEGETRGARCGRVAICRHGLVAPGRHQITIEAGGQCDE